MKFYIHTLGCKMNWLDSARIGAALQGAGHVIVAREEEAEYVLVNSCTVTAEADRKSHREADAAARRQKRVAVMGCGPKVDRNDWRSPTGDTLVFGTDRELLEHFGVDSGNLPFPLTSRTRVPVVVQTGCDNTCTFCITRMARGKHRTIPAQSIIDQVRQADERGIREVILTGINLAAWGCENSNDAKQARLPQLLERLLRETGMPRIRLGSLGPQYLDRRFFEVFADPRICAHLHLSVQSGSPGVLERMDRGHGADEVLAIAGRARAARPDVALAADLIVGFPGEGEREFGETLAMVETVGFAKLHVFPYSPREGTPAAVFSDPVDVEEKKRRAATLRRRGKALRAAFLEAQLGREHEVLVEHGGTGLTGNYVRVRMIGAAQGELIPVRLRREDLAETTAL